MDAIWFMFFIALGFVFFCFSFAQILMVCFCAIPLTKRIASMGALKSKHVSRMNVFTIVVQIVIGAIVFLVLFSFAKTSMIYGFFAGFFIAFLMMVSRLGMTENNVNEFISNNAENIDFEILNGTE